MLMITFPSVIQQPSFPIDISYEDIALQSKKENGVVKIRKKFSNARVTFKLTWNTMSVHDYKILEDFYINDCETNVNEFVWKYPNIANSNETITDSVFHGHLFIVRFSDFSVKASEYSYYTVSITLKGVSYVKSKSKPVYGEIIPIVYGNVSTYLMDNTDIDGTLVWGEQKSNSDTGYVNNYISEKYFSDNNVVDADINKDTSEVYTAYVSNPNNQYIINAGSSVNSFAVKRNNGSYKDINSDYLMQKIRSKVYPIPPKLQEKIRTLGGVAYPTFVPVTNSENSAWKNFKVDSDGFFDITMVPSYDYAENYNFQEGPMYDVDYTNYSDVTTLSQSSTGKSVRVVVNYNGSYVPYYNGNNSGHYGVKILTTHNVSDKYKSVFSNPYLNNDFNTITVEFCEPYPLYPSHIISTSVRVQISWAIQGVKNPSPTFMDSSFLNKAKNNISRLYPNASKIEIPGNSTSHHWRGYASIISVIEPETKEQIIYNSKYDRTGYIPKNGASDFHQTEFYQDLYIIYSVRVKNSHTKASVNLNSILSEQFKETVSFTDVRIQGGYFARFTCNHGSTINNTSYTFVGIYSAEGYLISKPSINIGISDNLSIIKLSNGSYLFGVHNKGLYWIKKDGSIQTMVNNNLYNFRLNYKQREI